MAYQSSISGISKTLCIIGSVLLIVMAVFHGSGYSYVADAIGESDAEGFLKQIVQSTPVPVVAIGGIDPSNTARVMDAGAHGIAVISAVCCQTDPQKATRDLHHIVWSKRE